MKEAKADNSKKKGTKRDVKIIHHLRLYIVIHMHIYIFIRTQMVSNERSSNGTQTAYTIYEKHTALRGHTHTHISSTYKRELGRGVSVTYFYVFFYL